MYLYLQALPGEAGPLRVEFAGVSVLRHDGGEVPLALSLGSFTGPDVKRQRLLASGPLPAGDYDGLAFRVSRATLHGAQGESALLVPDASTRLTFPFTMRRRAGTVIELALRYGASVEAAAGFRPVFDAHVPDRPPVGLMGLVVNARSNDVTLFNKRTLQVFDVVATGQGPLGLALDPRELRAYVALSVEDRVDVIDILAGQVSDRIQLTPGDEPVDLALAPDGRTLLSANRRSNSVSVMDPHSRVELTRIQVEGSPRSVLLEPTGRRAFVFNAISSTVSVIDVPAALVVRSIPTESGPIRGAFNRRGDRLYVIHEHVPYVTVINPGTLAVTGRFQVRSPMRAIKVDPGTELIYLASSRDASVGVYDPFSLAPVDTLVTGASIAHMATDREENLLYLASPDRDRVLVSSRIRRRIVGEVDVGDGPSRISVIGEN